MKMSKKANPSGLEIKLSGLNKTHKKKERKND
jgi:hypothetical protein